MRCILFMKKFKKTIQFNNKPLLMKTQAIKMIVITVPLTYFSFVSIKFIYVTQQWSVSSQDNYIIKFPDEEPSWYPTAIKSQSCLSSCNLFKSNNVSRSSIQSKTVSFATTWKTCYKIKLEYKIVYQWNKSQSTSETQLI